MEARHQHPQQAQQTQDQERIVEPQSAACISSHQNECSAERVFWRKGVWRHNRITPLAIALLLLLLSAGCLPEPQRLQSVELLGQLVSARTLLSGEGAQVDQACAMVGSVETRLFGEPGLVDTGAAWTALRDAAQALHAACGKATFLRLPSTESLVLQAARLRWQQGIQTEVNVACDHLRGAATALGRPEPC